ncbi:MAG: hypothetical protein HY340_02535 [Candidatus Kerfeldbacteria bacterium]|nr:hypothetical protein [Candidatus Kerfeldbacteria bacterium]
MTRWFALAFLVWFWSAPALAQQTPVVTDTTYSEEWALGIFHYPYPDGREEIRINPPQVPTPLTGAVLGNQSCDNCLSGALTDATLLRFANRSDITRRSLDLINRRKVFAYAKLRTVRRGDTFITSIEEITIYLLD